MGFKEPSEGELCFPGDHSQGDHLLRCQSTGVGRGQQTLELEVGGSVGGWEGLHNLCYQEYGFPKIPALGIPPSLPPLQNDVTRLSSATASFPEGGFNNQVEGRRSASNGLAGRARSLS